MSEPNSEKLGDLLGRALDLPPGEREAYVERMCADDPALRAELLRLLTLHSNTPDDFLSLDKTRAPEDAGLVGVHLGKFRILHRIGHGGVGAVYLARQPGLERDVAIKVLVEGPGTSATQIERFHRESRATAKLTHPSIVPVYDDGQVGPVHWFAMEYIEGQDLQVEIDAHKKGQAPNARAAILPRREETGHFAAIARVCAEIAEALHHAHSKGVVHRDVKPGNVLLRPNGHALIVDFGISRDRADIGLTKTGDTQGTPHYMSPEQARAVSDPVDHRTDVYSLGVVLYELLTLHTPFRGRTEFEVILQIRDREPVPPRRLNPKTPRDLETICLKAMAKRAAARYRTAEAFARDLRLFLGHEAIEARPPGIGDRAAHWVRRHRVALGAAMLLVVGLFVGRVVTEAQADARAQARVSVELLDAAGGLVRGTAHAQRLDLRSGMPTGERVYLGSLPLRDAGLEPGYYRVLVTAPDGRVLTYTRDLRAGRLELVRGAVPPPTERTAGMVQVPGGELYVSDLEVGQLSQIDRLRIPVATFWLDAYEVTNRQYGEFLRATGHPAPTHWDELRFPDHDNLPVVRVGWTDARAYAEWVGKRLPTLAELTWEGRGKEARRLPFPDELVATHANSNHPRVVTPPGEEISLYLSRVEPVDSRAVGRSPNGAHHLFGNVAEWTESVFCHKLDGGWDPRFTHRLAFGFAWDASDFRFDLRYFSHQQVDRQYANHKTGFRLALDASH